jgi:hypothetical protein
LGNGSVQGHRDNRLLAALPSETLNLMGHDLRQISLAQGRAIYEPGASIDEIYFPQSGMISLLVWPKMVGPSRRQRLAAKARSACTLH